MADITPTKLKDQARQLLHDKKMPTPEEFARIMQEVRDEYVPKAEAAIGEKA